MVNEFKHWRSEYNASTQKLTDLQKQPEDTIKPLQDELAQVEEKIREKTSQIQNLRRQIIWNDTTI